MFLYVLLEKKLYVLNISPIFIQILSHISQFFTEIDQLAASWVTDCNKGAIIFLKIPYPYDGIQASNVTEFWINFCNPRKISQKSSPKKWLGQSSGNKCEIWILGHI